jgi:sulfide dehydrogenase cytochrome subunit
MRLKNNVSRRKVKMNRTVLGLLLSFCAVSVAPVMAGDIDGLARTCNNCHGVNGVTAGGSMPSIGGQSEAYLKKVMTEWKSGERSSASMTRLVKGLSDEEIAALAKYFASKPWVPQPAKMSAEVAKTGKDVTEKCEACHGATGSEPDGDDTPKLHGQSATYMHLEMNKYRSEGFKMTHKKMQKTMSKVDDAAVTTAAQFYAGQSK